MNDKNFQNHFLENVFFNNPEIDPRIVPIGNLSSSEVIRIYQNDYKARMLEVLRENFESIWHVLGDEDFARCCMDYIEKYPSSFKDLRFYGHQFSCFLRETSFYQNFPFLVDLANFETDFWHIFHLSFLEPQDAFALIDLNLVGNYKIVLDDNSRLISSSWDIVSIWQNREKKSEEIDYHWNEEVFALLFKQRHNVKILKLSKDQFVLLSLLNEGHSLFEVFEKNDVAPEVVSEVFALLRTHFIPVQLSI